MTEHNEAVARQRLLLEAEEWATGIKDLHVHSLSSMWYDNRPQDTSEGKSVIDVHYNSGLIKRRLNDGTEVYFGKELKGDDLIYEYEKTNA